MNVAHHQRQRHVSTFFSSASARCRRHRSCVSRSTDGLSIVGVPRESSKQKLLHISAPSREQREFALYASLKSEDDKNETEEVVVEEEEFLRVKKGGWRASSDSAIRRNALKYWSEKTQKYAELATVPLLAVTVPQILKNQRNIVSGNSHLLAGISYQGYACGALGNLLLLSYFSSIDELAGRNIQAIGVVNTCFLLSQLYFTGNCGGVNFPTYALCAFVATFGIVSAYFTKSIFKENVPLRKKCCALYERTLGVIGYTFVPYILSEALLKTSREVPIILSVIAFCTIALRCAKDYFEWENAKFSLLNHFMRLKWQTLMGWTATLLFSLLPIAQISTSTTDPINISSLSLSAVILGGAGNALMFARAWHIRDWCWTIGSFGGSAVGSWGVLLTMFIYGHQNVLLSVFLTLSALYWGWVGFVVLYDATLKRKENGSLY